jgi:hypothetical protein
MIFALTMQLAACYTPNDGTWELSTPYLVSNLCDFRADDVQPEDTEGKLEFLDPGSFSWTIDQEESICDFDGSAGFSCDVEEAGTYTWPGLDAHGELTSSWWGYPNLRGNVIEFHHHFEAETCEGEDCRQLSFWLPCQTTVIYTAERAGR